MKTRSGEVEAVMFVRSVRQAGDDTKGLRVTLESRSYRCCLVLCYEVVELFFGDVSEWWMTDIVGKRSGLDDIGIDLRSELGVLRCESLSESPSDLRDLQRVGEAVVEQLRFVASDHLRDFPKPTKLRAV